MRAFLPNVSQEYIPHITQTSQMQSLVTSSHYLALNTSYGLTLLCQFCEDGIFSFLLEHVVSSPAYLLIEFMKTATEAPDFI